MKRSALISLTVLLWAGSADAAPTLRKKLDLRGDVVTIGHTMGYDCGAAAAPPMGTTALCTGVLESDKAPDAYWQDNTAFPALDSTLAATSARLTIPSGATVVYARLYWGALLNGLLAAPDPDLTIRIRAPGATTDTTFTALASEASKLTATGPASPTVPYIVYQSSVDVTSFVNASKSGVYRVTDIASIALNGVATETAFSAWTLVVVYSDPTAAYRHIALHDGLDLLDGTTGVATVFDGFKVSATPAGSLTVWGYDGDHLATSDSVRVNAATMSDSINLASDFFNSSRSRFGAAISGESPPVTGAAGTMAGFDLDTVDLTPRLTAGATSATAEVVGSATAAFWLGGLVSSIESAAPKITATKTFIDLNGGAPLPGDTLEFTLTARNDGDDAAINTVITDVLPAGLTYVAGSLKSETTALTDPAGDDAGEVVSGTVTARVGTGATSTGGGTIAPGASASITFRVTISGAPGSIVNTGNVRAAGAGGAPPTDTPTDGDPVTPGSQGTTIAVKECDASGGCVAPRVCQLTTNTCVDPPADAGADAAGSDTGDASADSIADTAGGDTSAGDTSGGDSSSGDTAGGDASSADGSAGGDTSSGDGTVADSGGEDTGGDDGSTADSGDDTGANIDGSVVDGGGDGAPIGDADDLNAFVVEGGGCGCRTSTSSSSTAPLAAIALALLLARRRRS